MQTASFPWEGPKSLGSQLAGSAKSEDCHMSAGLDIMRPVTHPYLLTKASFASNASNSRSISDTTKTCQEHVRVIGCHRILHSSN